MIGLGSRVGLDLRGAGGRAWGGLQANIIIILKNKMKEENTEKNLTETNLNMIVFI